MANPSATLARFINWPRIIELLGLDAFGTELPKQLTCPFCGRRDLWVYDDATLGGVWLHCRNWRFAGDSVELCARLWKTDVPSALSRLQREAVFPKSVAVTEITVDRYLRDH